MSIQIVTQLQAQSIDYVANSFAHIQFSLLQITNFPQRALQSVHIDIPDL